MADAAAIQSSTQLLRGGDAPDFQRRINQRLAALIPWSQGRRHPERVTPHPPGQPTSGRRSDPLVVQRALMPLSWEHLQDGEQSCIRLQEITVPAIELRGTEDFVLPYEYGLAWQAEIKRAETQPAKGTGCSGFQRECLMLKGKILRIARPTDQLDKVVRFYTEGLGLEILFQFEDHEGFDGVMVGIPGERYHFEFTQQRGHLAGRAPTQDNLIVYYLPDQQEWLRAVERMKATGYEPVKSYNPFWQANGVTFEDPDGYRIVLQNTDWET